MARRTKSQNAKANTVMCSICEKAIVDSGRKGQDSIFCEGSCQAWLHRCCAGLTRTRFDELSDDNASFHCPSCVAEKQTRELADLKSVVVALAQEVTQLKESLASVTAAQAALLAETSKRTYAAVTGRRRDNTNTNNQRSMPTFSSSSSTSKPPTSKTNNGESALPSMSKVKVVGARRIWGTLRDCTVKSVKNVIVRVCKIDRGVHVKRKVKENPVTNKVRWWFVLHGSESLLCDLEEKWPQVNLQTSWKLEPCYKPIDSLSPGSDSCPSDNIIPANSTNSATSTIVEPSIHDNAGKDSVSVIDNSTIVCTSPEIPPPKPV